MKPSKQEAIDSVTEIGYKYEERLSKLVQQFKTEILNVSASREEEQQGIKFLSTAIIMGKLNGTSHTKLLRMGIV